MAGLFRYFNTLAGKLILTVCILLFCGSLLFGLIYFKFQERVMLGNIADQARLSSNLVKMGVHHGMLSADSSIIQLSIGALGSTEYVREIMIYSTEGRVAYSSNPEYIGRVSDKDSTVAGILRGGVPEPRILRDPEGRKVLEYMSPILNEPDCYTAACHFHGEDERILGVLQTNFNASEIETTERQMFAGTLVLGGVFVFFISVFMFAIIYKFVSKPVAALEEGMKRLAKGDMDHPIQIDSQDEMGLLAKTFNSMVLDIKRYRERLENWTKELQEEVDKKTAEILQAQEQLIDAEKLASLGRLSAGVAHELNNPLTGIITFAHLVRESLPPDSTQCIEDMDVIIEQANKCSSIIKGLLGFARKGSSEKMSININDLIESSISMVRNQSKFHNIKTDLRLSEPLPSVTVDPNQIQQVVLNIFTNASDAMNDRGEISISTRVVSENGVKQVEMEFTDNGPGILPKHMSRIFEPFFTTKPVGKGTGLGLPVSYGIVKRHGGDIIVKSKVGKGTSFTVRLPSDTAENNGKEA